MASSRSLCGFAVFLVLSGSMSAAKGQVGPDEPRSNWRLGDHRGSLHLRISDMENKYFEVSTDEFARDRSFVKVSSANGPILSGREFISDWYRRSDGVTISVTDMTVPEKMRVMFYDRGGGKGAAEAEQAFLESKSFGARFRRYE